MSVNLENFDWGWLNGEESLKRLIDDEIFIKKIYERFLEVKEGDIVLDIGSSIGPFAYSIMDKNPKKVICVEPSPFEHETLETNVLSENVKIIKKGITKNDGDVIDTSVFGGVTQELKGISFKTLIEENDIKTIDFLKTDCEGGEYEIFNIENLCWLKNNMKYSSGEWHLSSKELKEKFRVFRDVFLRVFPNHEIYSVDGVNIKWDLWNEHFIEYYNEVIIYIDNR